MCAGRQTGMTDSLREETTFVQMNTEDQLNYVDILQQTVPKLEKIVEESEEEENSCSQWCKRQWAPDYVSILYFILVAETSLRAGFQVYLS